MFLYSLCPYVFRGKWHKGELPLKEQNKACFCLCSHAAQPAPEHRAPQHVGAHGHKPFVHLVAQLHFGCAVKHIKANVVQFVRKGDGLFSQTAVRSIASCLRCAVDVVAHAFLLQGVSVFLVCGSGLCPIASISLSTPRFTMASA
jgi:hypothetical protein